MSYLSPESINTRILLVVLYNLYHLKYNDVPLSVAGAVPPAYCYGGKENTLF